MVHGFLAKTTIMRSMWIGVYTAGDLVYHRVAAAENYAVVKTHFFFLDKDLDLEIEKEGSEGG